MTDDPPHTISCRQVAGVLVIEILEPRIFEGPAFECLRGELVNAIVPSAGLRVVLDFSKVELMSSEMLGFLVTLYRDLVETGGKLVLVGVQDPLQKVFAVTKLDRLFRIAPDAEAAIQIVTSAVSPQP